MKLCRSAGREPTEEELKSAPVLGRHLAKNKALFLEHFGTDIGVKVLHTRCPLCKGTFKNSQNGSLRNFLLHLSTKLSKGKLSGEAETQLINFIESAKK